MRRRRGDDDVHRVVEGIRKRGWYPVKWAHHPPEIKELIRRAGFRPQVKQCFMNCQRVFMAAFDYAPHLNLELHEGWVTTLIPFEHCWLTLDDEIVDLTLPPEKRVIYGEPKVVTYDELLVHLAITGYYGATDPQRLWETGPHAALLKYLNHPEGP